MAPVTVDLRADIFFSTTRLKVGHWSLNCALFGSIFIVLATSTAAEQPEFSSRSLTSCRLFVSGFGSYLVNLTVLKILFFVLGVHINLLFALGIDLLSVPSTKALGLVGSTTF